MVHSIGGCRGQPETEDLQLCSEGLETLTVVLMLCPNVLEKLALVSEAPLIPRARCMALHT